MWQTPMDHPLLQHPTRRGIMDLAHQEPGIHFSALLERLSAGTTLGSGSLSHHLYVLERAQFLTSRRSGRHRRYYAANGPRGEATALSVLQRTGTEKVARCILENGEATQREIARFIGPERPASRQVVAYYIRMLKTNGLVEEEKMGRCRRYLSTPRLGQLLGILSRPDAAPNLTLDAPGASAACT